MTKVYKHKKLGWNARETAGDEFYRIDKVTKDTYSPSISLVPKELIENSQDREEVVEKDWIDDARLLYNDLHDRPEKDFREAIEKHAPQVKKISKEDIKRYMSTLTLNEQTYLNGKFLREFLKDHGLLEE